MKCLYTEVRLVKMTRSAHPFAEPLYGGRGSYNTGTNRSTEGGFTLIELMVVVIILGIAALTAIPMMSSAGSIQIRSAANKIAADLEYAKSMAISRGQNYSVIFNTSAESYQIEDQAGNVVAHPVKKGFDYTVGMVAEGLGSVDITSVNFNSNTQVSFDCLGSPDNGGTVNLQGGGTSMTVTVEPITGYVTIN